MVGRGIKTQRIIPPLDRACATFVVAFSNYISLPHNHTSNAGLRCSTKITIQSTFSGKTKEAFFQINLTQNYRIVQGQC